MSEPSLADILDACTERCRELDAPLDVRLKTMAGEVRKAIPDIAAVFDRLVERLQQAHAGSSAPAVGQPMPEFVLPNESGRLVSLSGLLKRGPVVVAFHRGHWCPYCRINAAALAAVEPTVRAAGAQIVAITPEIQTFAAEMKAEARAAFPILSDMDSGYAFELGLAFRLGEEQRAAMTRLGRDLVTFQGNSSWTLPIPATFVVGTDGRVKARFVDPDYRKRMATEDILIALRA